MQSDLFSLPAVAAHRLAVAQYPAERPFHPGVAYPEYQFGTLGLANPVYDSVRQLFQLLKLDEAHFGTTKWNPLGCVVRPGDSVVLKPNLIWHSHREFEQVITHGSVVRAVLDYVLIALQGRGKVWVADGPQLDADWTLILARTGLGAVCDWSQVRTNIPIRFLDLRDTWEDVRGEVLYGTTPLPGDPAGSVDVNHAAGFSATVGQGVTTAPPTIRRKQTTTIPGTARNIGFRARLPNPTCSSTSRR